MTAANHDHAATPTAINAAMNGITEQRWLESSIGKEETMRQIAITVLVGLAMLAVGLSIGHLQEVNQGGLELLAQRLRNTCLTWDLTSAAGSIIRLPITAATFGFSFSSCIAYSSFYSNLSMHSPIFSFIGTALAAVEYC